MEVPDLPCAPVEHIDTRPMTLHFNGVAILRFAGNHKTSSSNGGIVAERGLVEFGLDVSILEEGAGLILCSSMAVASPLAKHIRSRY
jgi:hypothetical protein